MFLCLKGFLVSAALVVLWQVVLNLEENNGSFYIEGNKRQILEKKTLFVYWKSKKAVKFWLECSAAHTVLFEKTNN